MKVEHTLDFMKVEHTLEMKSNETGNDFDNRVINFITKQYKFSDKNNVSNALKNALAYDWALAVEGNKIVGIQSSYDRSKIYIGQ